VRTMLKSKIHRARVTECNIDYEGSITIDRELMEAADIIPYEKVEVLNIYNGARFSTYDLVIILSYHDLPEEEASTTQPRLVYVDSLNRIKEEEPKDQIHSFLSKL
jgi:aspartate 1-decarboxylase